jgi:hypothetical protein
MRKKKATIPLKNKKGFCVEEVNRLGAHLGSGS